MENILTGDQTLKLQVHNWEVKPEGAYLDLYPDDFKDDETWIQICDTLEVPYNTDHISILYFGKKQINRYEI